MYNFSKDWPELNAFSTGLPVRITDVNYGKHLGNDALLGLVHEARMRFLAERGCSEEDCGDGVGLIMRGLQVRFLAQAVYGDVLVCQVGIVKEGPIRRRFQDASRSLHR